MSELLVKYIPNLVELSDEFVSSTLETIYMTLVTAVIAGSIGIILGVILVVTDWNGIKPHKLIYGTLDKLINVCRSIPFIIMLVAVAPLTRLLVWTMIGTTASIVPLVIGTVPFFSRQIQNALLEVDHGVIEAAQSMGSSTLEIIFRVYLREGLPAIVRASALTIINLIGLTAMAGAVGGGGLGNLAVARGFNRFQNDVTLVATLIILVLVFMSQALGNYLIKKTDHA